MRDPYRVLGVSKSASEDEIRRAYTKLRQKHDPRNFVDMREKDRHRVPYHEVERAYLQLTTVVPLHVRTDMHSRFDSVFEEMEKRVEAMVPQEKDGGKYYSKETYVCTRNGKTIIKIEENINGDIKRFESYDTRPNPVNPTITIE